jgi:Hemerythrin HHE cation binding domain
MTTRNLVPGSSDAARHGTGDADLTIMLAAHAAFRRDLAQLARAAAFADLPDPRRRASVRAGWELFKRQLNLHHTAEDVIVWPALRERLTRSDHAQSVLDAMEAEHQQIDPLLAAVDGAFARADDGHRAGAIGDGAFARADDGHRAGAIGDAADALARSLTGHLTHEERDGLPLIGEALTSAEWRGVGFKIVRKNGLSAGGEMFAWLADGADPDQAAAAIGTLPPPARLVYRAIWKPRYNRTSRW